MYNRTNVGKAGFVKRWKIGPGTGSGSIWCTSRSLPTSSAISASLFNLSHGHRENHQSLVTIETKALMRLDLTTIEANVTTVDNRVQLLKRVFFADCLLQNTEVCIVLPRGLGPHLYRQATGQPSANKGEPWETLQEWLSLVIYFLNRRKLLQRRMFQRMKAVRRCMHAHVRLSPGKNIFAVLSVRIPWSTRITWTVHSRVTLVGGAFGPDSPGLSAGWTFPELPQPALCRTLGLYWLQPSQRRKKWNGIFESYIELWPHSAFGAFTTKHGSPLREVSSYSSRKLPTQVNNISFRVYTSHPEQKQLTWRNGITSTSHFHLLLSLSTSWS